MSTPEGKSRLYFAHPANIYNAPLEDAVIQLIVEHFLDAVVENPNQPHHRVGYDKYAERVKLSSTAHKGMNYFYDEVLPQCDGCVVMPFLDGRMGLGVAGEAKWFVERSLPVWTVFLTEEASLEALRRFTENPQNGCFCIRQLTKGETTLLLGQDPQLVVPHEETRLRTWKIYNRERRPYEEAHLVSMPIPPGFYPDKP